MAATTTDRNTYHKQIYLQRSVAVKAATSIPKGVLVAVDATGYAVNASDAANLKVVGVSWEAVDNSDGASGDLRIKVEEGVFALGVAGDLTVADVGKKVYVSDNQTVAEATGTNSIVAGELFEIDAEGTAWIKVARAAAV